MKEAFQVAQQNMEKCGEANKRRYDAKIKTVNIEVGDNVLVRNVEKGGTGKLKSWWERKLYKVVEKFENIPVFVVKPIEGGAEKKLHRNMLMEANDIPPNIFGQMDDQ